MNAEQVNAEIDDRLERLITWTAQEIMNHSQWMPEPTAFKVARARVANRLAVWSDAPTSVE